LGVRRTGLLLLIAGVLATAIAYAAVLTGVAGEAAPWLLALGAASTLAGIACLGAARARTLGAAARGRTLGAAIGVAFAAVAAGLLLALAMPAPVADGPLLLGLPRVTALLLLLAGLVPLLLLPIAYAVAFDEEVISERDIERVRAATRTATRATARATAPKAGSRDA